jgi:hypothetical protein
MKSLRDGAGCPLTSILLTVCAVKCTDLMKVRVHQRGIYKKNIKTKKRRIDEIMQENTRKEKILRENTATNPLAYV